MAASPKIYGLLGFPVKHSLSAVMHNAAFRALKINAEYKLFEIKPQGLEKFFYSLAERNIRGLNVTIPHKEKVIPFLDNLSGEARLIGAVNTIKLEKNRLEGFNTDGQGFLRHLQEDLKFNPRAKVIAIAGAGGASRAISVYLAKAKPKAIAIYDVDENKLKSLVTHLRSHFPGIQFKEADAVEGLDLENAALFINATPLGMKEGDPLVIDESFIHRRLLVYDLIYNPQETRLLRVARVKGARAASGLGMLLYQGIGAFEIWTGRPAPAEAMKEALNEGVKKI